VNTGRLLLHDVEIDGTCTDVVIDRGTITAVAVDDARGRDVPGVDVIDGEGGALIPGLWDHHLHLLALAAAADSVPVGPDVVHDAAGLAAALHAAARTTPTGAWIRAVGYHERVAGDLDRDLLDTLVPSHPVRVQHRSGALWVLNSQAAKRVGSDEPSGRLFGADDWLRARLGPPDPPDLAAVGARLARYGITGVTDATPSRSLTAVQPIAAATSSGALPQRVLVTGGPDLTSATFPASVAAGPVKIVLTDHDLPALDDVSVWMATAHDHGRAVAVHCVTRAALVLALAAWSAAGPFAGDRIEHGAVIPPELFATIGHLGLTVVTQPHFVAERGDDYLRDVEPEDVPHLYRCGSLLAAGIEVAAGTDAPFGSDDPWRAMVAACRRTTDDGVVLEPEERVDASIALDLFLGPPGRPGGRRRRVATGAPADLCLLDAPFSAVLDDLSAARVRATIIAGTVVFER